MSASRGGSVLQQIRRMLEHQGCRGQTDAELLQDFIVRRDDNAFATLMHRHAALVWAVCRHLLPGEHDAEDAFQATFLILARRAAQIRKAESLGSWLHGVAYRVATRARKNIKKRQRHEQAALVRTVPAPSDLAWCELQAVLDEEVQRLPEKYRAPFVLCCLEGRTREQAAHELQANENTISSRVARARQLLQVRLARRGVTLSAALCACTLWQQSAAAVVPFLLVRNVSAAISGGRTVSAAAATLAGQVVRGFVLARWQGRLLVLLALLMVTGGAGLCGHMHVQDAAPAAKEVAEAKPATRQDVHGDPLPRGVLARLGTARQRAADSQVAISVDGSEIITLSSDLVVRRFDAASGMLRSIRHIPGTRAYGTWLSPHGTYAALPRYQRGYRLEIWDLERIERRAELALDYVHPAHVAFSGDERRVGVIGGDRMRKHQVLIWDWPISTSRTIWSLERQINSFFLEPVIALSPDGKYAVACHLDQEPRAWDLDTGKLLWDGKKRPWSPFMSISPDGRTVASTSMVHNGLALYDLVTGAPRVLPHRLPAKPMLIPIGFTPDSRGLVFQTGFEEMLLWEPATGRVTLELPRPARRRNTKTMTSPNKLPANFAFTPDGKALVRRADILQRWELATGKPVFGDTEVWGHTEAIARLAFAPDGRSLASVALDQTARVWDLATSQTRHLFATGGSNHLAFLPGGDPLLLVPFEFSMSNTALNAWDVRSGKVTRTFTLKDRKEFMTLSRDRELCVTADGKRILMLSWKNGKAGDESMMSIWDIASGDCLQHKRVPWSEDSIFTPDGNRVLAVDSRTRTPRLLDVEMEAVLSTFETDAAAAPQTRTLNYDLAMSANGRLLAVRFHNIHQQTGEIEHDVLRINDVATGLIAKKLSVDGLAIFTFSADSRQFAVAAADSVRLWETASWKEVGKLTTDRPEELTAGNSFATALAFAPDGRTLATGHADCTILLWDATLRDGARGRPLTEQEARSLWEDLAGADAQRAYAAVWKLADDPSRALPLLRDKLRPVAGAPEQQMQTLLGELDSAAYATRQQAAQKLQDLGDAATPALRRALQTKLSLEMRRRIEALLEKMNTLRPFTSEELRGVRAVQVLEQMGSAEARDLLSRLAQGADSARLTQAAQEAVNRLKAKP